MSIINNANTIIVNYGSGSNTFNKSITSIESTDDKVTMYHNSVVHLMSVSWDLNRAIADGFDTLAELLEYLNDAVGGGTGTILASGTATLVGGQAIVETTKVLTDSLIHVSVNTPGGTQGFLSTPEADIVNLTSFVINSTERTDTSTAGYQVVDVGGAKAGGTATGLANNATVYTASIVVDGVTKAIAITGSTAQTYTTLIAQLNTDLGVSAVAAIVSGNLRVTSATTGDDSSVAITDTDLFDTLTDFVEIDTAVAGNTSFTGETSTVNWWITA